MIALGAAAAHAQYAPDLLPTEMSKPWALSATIRGFYDDNYLTLPKTIPGTTPGTFVQGARDSYGVELSPSISFNHSTADTLLSATYVYDMRWYEDRDGTTDQSHQFSLKMNHEFSERYKLTVGDTFVVAQEPQVIDPAIISTPLRVSGNNVHNTGTVDFTAQLTRLFDLHVGYANSIYVYQQNLGDEYSSPFVPLVPSYSALLDRMDQTAAVDLRWKASPETTGVLGYQYESLQYTSPENIIFSTSGSPNGPGSVASSIRNQNSDYVYVGADQSFSPNLNGSIRAGGQWIDYYNYGTSTLSPYIDANLTYQYMPQSTLQVGVKHVHNSTDVVGIVAVGDGTPVLDEESTAAYMSISHRVTSRFTVAAMGQAQFSTFNGGGTTYNGQEEDFYIANVNFAYHFNPWLTGETGYNYSRLVTVLADRGYARDIVYIGIRAAY
jgi:hypothetical protein